MKYQSLVAISLFFARLHAQETTERINMASSRMEQWREAKFGMFIHWGPYAVLAGEYNDKKVAGLGEWIMQYAKIPVHNYRNLANQFTAENYQASEWVDLAKRCGARYIVVTAKHHDGFALFNSAVSDWDAVDSSAAKADLLKPLVEECKKQNMHLGFHYSQAQDWVHPGGGSYAAPWDKAQAGDFGKYYDSIALPQIKELCNNYGPVFSFFFDTPVQMSPTQAQATLAALPPNTVINNRLGGTSVSDYVCAEGQMPLHNIGAKNWELCTTMNASWGFKKEPLAWKDADDLLKELILTVSKGGNYLLNVGPLPDGSLPPQAIERFEFIGKWMHTNSESIYGTSASPFKQHTWNGACTQKNHADGSCSLYLHIFEPPTNGYLELNGLSNKDFTATVLGSDTPLTSKQSLNALRIKLPATGDQKFSVIEVKLKKAPDFKNPPAQFDEQGKLNLSALSAQLHGSTLCLERAASSPEMNVGYWTDAQNSLSWKIHLAASQKVSSLWNIACENASAGSEIAILADGQELARWTIPATGSWESYKTVKGPTFTLPEGFTLLELKPITKPGLGVVNLRFLSLVK